MSDKERRKKSGKERKNDSINDLTSELPSEILNIAQKVSTEDMEKYFPHLVAEISDDKMALGIDNVEGDFTPSKADESLPIDSDPFENYEPTVIDYLCRAKTDEEAMEIIDFLQKQGHISAGEASQLLDQLQKEGVRSFGPIRTPGHYFREAAEIRKRRVIQKRYSTPK